VSSSRWSAAGGIADRDARSVSDIEQIYLDGGRSFALPWLELKER
jgi:hypothetical protein